MVNIYRVMQLYYDIEMKEVDLITKVIKRIKKNHNFNNTYSLF